MDLLKNTTNIFATTESLVQIGYWLTLVDYKTKSLTQKQKNQIKMEFRKILTRLGYSEEEKCTILKDSNKQDRIRCRFSNENNIVFIDLYDQTHDDFAELEVFTPQSKSQYECLFKNGTITKMHLLKKSRTDKSLELQALMTSQSYSARITTEQETVQLTIRPCPWKHYIPDFNEYIDIPALENILQNINFPIELDPVFQQINGVLKEPVDKSYEMIITNYRQKELANQLHIKDGTLKTYIVAEAEEITNIRGLVSSTRRHLKED